MQSQTPDGQGLPYPIRSMPKTNIPAAIWTAALLHCSLISVIRNVFSNVDCVDTVMLSNMTYLVFLYEYDAVQVQFPYISSSYARNMIAFSFSGKFLSISAFSSRLLIRLSSLQSMTLVIFLTPVSIIDLL